jgi:hypothetical protein
LQRGQIDEAIVGFATGNVLVVALASFMVMAAAPRPLACIALISSVYQAPVGVRA